MMVINKENIEEYLLLLIDGELSTEDEMEVMTFVENNAEYQVLLDQYLDTKLEDEPLVFEGKESLLKPEQNVVPFKIRKPKILAWAAAVGGVIWIGIAFQLMRSDKIESTSPSLTQQVETTNHNIDSVPQQPIVASVQKQEPKAHKVQTIVSKNTKSANQPVQNANVATIDKTKEEHNVELLKPLPEAGFRPLNVNVEATANLASLPVPENKIEEPAPEKKNNGLPDESRLEAVNALLAQVETLKENVASKARVFKNMTVAIRLGGKEYTIGK